MKKIEIPKKIEVLEDKVAVLIRVVNKTVEKLDNHIEETKNHGNSTESYLTEEQLLRRKEKPTKPQENITDHEFDNPCWCGCDGKDMLCHHYNENGRECLKNKSDHQPQEKCEHEPSTMDFHGDYCRYCGKKYRNLTVADGKVFWDDLEQEFTIWAEGNGATGCEKEYFKWFRNKLSK